MKRIIKQVFPQTVPVLAGYISLGVGTAMLLHGRKRNTLHSIGASTLLYMVLIRLGIQGISEQTNRQALQSLPVLACQNSALCRAPRHAQAAGAGMSEKTHPSANEMVSRIPGTASNIS